MDADIFAVYKRLSALWPVSYSVTYTSRVNPDVEFKTIEPDFYHRVFPSLCTSDLNQYLKASSTNGSTA